MYMLFVGAEGRAEKNYAQELSIQEMIKKRSNLQNGSA